MAEFKAVKFKELSLELQKEAAEKMSARVYPSVSPKLEGLTMGYQQLE